MWPLFVVVPHPAIDDGLHLTQRFKAMTQDALLLQGPKEALHEPVLYRCIWRREFLSHAIGLHRARVVATAENQACYRSEGPTAAARARAPQANRSALPPTSPQQACCCHCPITASNDHTRVAVNDECQAVPTTLTAPHMSESVVQRSSGLEATDGRLLARGQKP